MIQKNLLQNRNRLTELETEFTVTGGEGRQIDWELGIDRRRRWHPTPALLPGKSHGRRSLVGCRPWGR